MNIADLRKVYKLGACSRKETVAVKGLSLHTGPGEILALLGHNGVCTLMYVYVYLDHLIVYAVTILKKIVPKHFN